MILYGNNITSVQDPLVKMPVTNVWHAVKNPKQETLALIRQLRIIRAIDYKRYSVLKRQLPYFVCGIFNPPCRRSEHFAYIEYFMLDIDRIAEKQLSVEELKRRLIQDKRVMLCFVSPGEDGLKLMFKLEERCFERIGVIFEDELCFPPLLKDVSAAPSSTSSVPVLSRRNGCLAGTSSSYSSNSSS